MIPKPWAPSPRGGRAGLQLRQGRCHVWGWPDLGQRALVDKTGCASRRRQTGTCRGGKEKTPAGGRPGALCWRLPSPPALPPQCGSHRGRAALAGCFTACGLSLSYGGPYTFCVFIVSHSVVSDSATPWILARQAPLSMGFSRQEYWSGLPFPSPGDLPDPGTDPGSPALQADS